MRGTRPTCPTRRVLKTFGNPQFLNKRFSALLLREEITIEMNDDKAQRNLLMGEPKPQWMLRLPAFQVLRLRGGY